MKKTTIPYQDLSYFTELIKSYLNEDKVVKDLYHRFPNLENFKEQIAEKQVSWAGLNDRRQLLSDALLTQYQEIESKDATLKNIESLAQDDVFTITTGHQLNLFTGPLYFLYKIISTINLCKQLQTAYPENRFVPVYWMATEDHDFEEIQYFNFKGRKIVFEANSTAAVGSLSTDGLDKVFAVLDELWPDSDYGKELKGLFKNAYLGHKNLADATRYLAHELFKNDGLVIVDGDDASLKKLMAPYFEDELLNNTSFKQVTETLKTWPTDFKVQVNPREVNLFYLTDAYRKRIIPVENGFAIDDTDIVFTTAALLEELEVHPERFSPNVIMRPLYQEVILPNLCYIGGGGELAYWLELKAYFEEVGVVFPMLLLRNSALLVTHKQDEKLAKMECSMQDLFLQEHELASVVTTAISAIDIDFTNLQKQLKQQFESLYDIATKTDKSFVGAVAAQEKKQLNGLENLEKRLLKAQKYKHSDHVERAVQLQQELFPGGTLQERKENFASFYLDHGQELLQILKEQLDPLDPSFTVITLPVL